MTNKAVSDADATGGPAQENEEHRNELRNSPPDTGTEKVSRLLEYVNTEQIKNFDKEGLKTKR